MYFGFGKCISVKILCFKTHVGFKTLDERVSDERSNATYFCRTI